MGTPVYLRQFPGEGGFINKMVKRYLLWSTKRRCWMVNSCFNDFKRGLAFAPVDLQPNSIPKIDASLRWTVFDGVGIGYSEDPSVKSYMEASNAEVDEEEGS